MTTDPRGASTGSKPTFKDAPVKGPPQPTHDPHAPVPILQAHGFHGSIDSFNQRVQKTVDAYQATHGKRPSPGLVFDVARSPHVIDGIIQPPLFDVAQTPLRANMRSAQARDARDGKTWSERPDGLRDTDNHYKSIVPTIDHPTADYPNYKAFYTAKKAKYQMVPMGFIPNLTGALGGLSTSDIWNAAARSSDPKWIGMFGKITPDEADRILKASKLQGSSLVDPYNKAEVSGDETAYAKSVKTVAGVQEHLIKEAPYKFAGLVTDGYMTPGWIRAFSSWSRSDDYGMQSLKFYAKQNHFEPTARGVAEMNKANRYKMALMNDPTQVMHIHTIQAIPLRVIANMNFKNGLPHDPVQFMKNVWAYMNTNTSSNPVIGGLQDVFHGVELGFSLGSGVITQSKADMLALTSVSAAVIDATMHGQELPREQAAELIAEKLKENPTWAKILSGGMLTDKNEPSWAKVLDQTSNFALDLFIGVKFANTRFAAVAHTKKAAESSVAIHGSSRLAYNAIKHGDLRQAIRDLHGGKLSERFVVEASKWINSGKMDFKTFHGHVTDLYGEFKTTIGEDTHIDGQGILGDYSSSKMRNMGPTGFAARTVIRHVDHLADSIEREALGLQFAGHAPLGNAEKLLRGVRSMVGNALPTGAKEIFADRFPHDLHNFLVGNGVVTREESTKIVNSFIRARAHNNVGQMEAILTDVHKMYRDKFPLDPGKRDPSIFEPFVETEQASRFNFPSGGGIKGYEPTEGLVTAGEAIGAPPKIVKFAGEVGQSAKRMGKEPISASISLANATNTLLNRISHVWRTIILTKNVGRFWKHATRDPIAAMLGGYTPKVASDVKLSAAEAKAYLDGNPAIFRQYSTARGRSSMSELHWLSGDYWVDGQKAWNMKDFYGKDVPKGEAAVRLTGAAGYVRKLTTSDAYDAYMASTRDNIEPLVDVILSNPGIKNAFWSHQDIINKFRGTLGDMKGEGISTKHQMTLDEGFAGKEKIGSIQIDEAHQYAQKLFDRYFEVEKAIEDTGGHFDDLWKIFHADPGLADETAGSYLKKNMVPIQVHDGTMVVRSGWDQLSEKIIKSYMAPNFLSRNKLFDHTFNSIYHDYRAAGGDVEGSIQAAAHTAERVTVKHMLDFTNQLQFEQKFRWLLPFITKHRLYVGWLASVGRQYPLLSMPVADIDQHLDPAGNVNIQKVFGLNLKMNMLRMMWLNTEDQPATIPAAKFIPGLEEHSGSWFGGTGEAVKTAYQILVGNDKTYEQAVAGKSPAAIRQIDRLMISYGIQWQQDHPGVPIPESSAVRHALITYSYQAITNDMMFTPIGFQGNQLPDDIQKLSDEYTKLYSTNPGKAADFLDNNPRVGLAFGIYKDTNVFWHTQAMFKQLREIRAKRDATESPLIDEFQRTGELSPENLQSMRAARKQYGDDYRALLVQDARDWTRTDVPGFPPGVVEKGADGKLHVKHSGPFGAGAALSDGAEQLDKWMLETFPNLKKSELLKVWGADQEAVQGQLDRLTLSMANNDPDQLAKMKAGFNAYLKPYRDLPLDPAGKVVGAYFDAREKWFQQALPIREAMKNASGPRKAELEDKLRLLDAQSQLDSTFTYKGKTYKGPAFAVSSYYDKTPPQRVLWVLKNLTNASYENLSSTDKLILGVGNSTPEMDAAWVAYHVFSRQYSTGQRTDYKGAQAGYKQYYAGVVESRFPGFMKDWLNSTKPKYQLVQQYKPIQDSHYKDDWNTLLGVASVVYKTHSAWKESQRVEYWQYHVVPAVLEAAKTMPQGFQDELAVAGGQKFISSLMSTTNNLRSTDGS